MYGNYIQFTYFELKCPLPLSWSTSALPIVNRHTKLYAFAINPGAGDGNGCYISTSAGTYGLPSGGNMGITITGQDIYVRLVGNGLEHKKAMIWKDDKEAAI